MCMFIDEESAATKQCYLDIGVIHTDNIYNGIMYMYKDMAFANVGVKLKDKVAKLNVILTWVHNPKTKSFWWPSYMATSGSAWIQKT